MGATVRCGTCKAALCDRQRVIAAALSGAEECAPRCLECLGAELGASPEQLCALVGRYLVHRECYRSDWRTARPCDADGQAACCPSRLENGPTPPSWYRADLFAPRGGEETPEPDLTVDAEEAGCGDLMVLLMRSIRKLPTGGVLALTARDPGAEQDIPSWCRLTGHMLLAGPVGPERATYYLRRTER